MSNSKKDVVSLDGLSPAWARQKARYHSDPEYRAKVLKKNRIWAQNNKHKIKKRRKKRGKNASRHTKPKLIQIGGETVQVFIAKFVAERIGMSLLKFNRFVMEGVFPVPTAEDELGSYWFSWDWIFFVESALSRRKKKSHLGVFEARDLIAEERRERGIDV